MKYIYLIISIFTLFIITMTIDSKDIINSNLWITFLSCTLATLYYDYIKK